MVQKIQMPERLDWALEGLVRAVLLHQPEDIYLFAAQHFDKILQSRQTDEDDAPIKNYEKDIPAQEDIAKTVIIPDLNESLISDNALLEDEAIEQAVIELEDTTESEQNIIEEVISAEQASIVAEGVPETTAASELEQDGGVEDSEVDKVPPTEEVELLDINPENTGPSDISQISEKIIEFEGAEEADKDAEVDDITEDGTGLEVENSTEAEKSVDAEDAGEAEETVEAEDTVQDEKVEDAEKSVDVEEIEEVDSAGDAEKIVDIDDTDEAVKSVEVEDIGEVENTEDIGDAEKLVDVEDTDEAVKSADVEEVRGAESEGSGDAEKLVDVGDTDEAVKSVDVEEAENEPEEAVKMSDVGDGDQTIENDTQPEDEKKELNSSSEEKIETVDDGDVISATDSQSIQNPEIVPVDSEENPGASVEESTGESLKDEDQIESSALDENVDTSLDDTIQTEPVSEMNSEINIPPTSLPEVVLPEDNNIATESVEPLIVKENVAVTNVQTSESQDNEARQNTDEVNDDTGSVEISETKESKPELEDGEFAPSAPPLELENSENSVDSKEEIQKNEMEQNNSEEPIKEDDKNSEETENTEETQKTREEETGNPDTSEMIENESVDEAKGQIIGEASAEASDSLDTEPAQDDANEKEEETPQNDSSAETNVLKQDDSETSNDNEVTAVAQPSEESEPQNSNESNTQIADKVLPSEPGPEKSDLDPETNNISEQEPIATQEASADSLIAPEAEDAPSLTEITSQEINESEINSKSEVDNSEKEAPRTGTDFLRSSGEFHDMIVVLPDDAFNTSNDADDIETLDSKTEDAQPTEEDEGNDDQVEAATKIQASYRGYRTRKKLKKLPAETETSEERSSLNEKTVTTNPEDKADETNEAKDVANDENTEGDIIPTDNEVDDTEGNEAAAATLIQSSYRGYRTRKNLKQTKEQKGTLSAEANNSDEVIAAGSPDKNQEPSQDELNEAATTIQKNYRGYRTRKNLTKSAKTDTGTSNVPNDNTP